MKIGVWGICENCGKSSFVTKRKYVDRPVGYKECCSSTCARQLHYKKDPWTMEHVSKGRTTYWNTPGVKELRSEMTKVQLQDPEQRKAHLERLQQHNKSEKMRHFNSERLKEQQKDLRFQKALREAASKTIKKLMSDPEFIKHRSERARYYNKFEPERYINRDQAASEVLSRVASSFNRKGRAKPVLQHQLFDALVSYDDDFELEYVVSLSPIRKKLRELGIRREFFRIDIAYPHKRLAIEVDGWSHDMAGQQDADQMRDKILESFFGWTVIRINNKEIKENLTSVTDRILSMIS